MKYQYEFLDDTLDFGVWGLDTRGLNVFPCSEIPGTLPLTESITKEELVNYLDYIKSIREDDITLALLSSYSQSFWPLKYIHIIKSGTRYLLYDRFWKAIDISVES